MAKTIAIVNQKGGVGKTTTAINLSAALNELGNRVLIIDCDPQHSATFSLGWRKADDELDVTLATKLQETIDDMETVKNGFGTSVKESGSDAFNGIKKHKEGFDVLPANIILSNMEISLQNVVRREDVLKMYIRKISDSYDYIILDSCPSLGLINVNVLSAADSVIIPVALDYLSSAGMTLLMRSISRVKSLVNPNIRIEGILLNQRSRKNQLTSTTKELIESNYGKHIRIFDTVIPEDSKLGKAPGSAESIIRYDRNSKGAQAYINLAKEVEENGRH